MNTAAAAAADSLQSCLTLCNPTDSSPPGFPVPGILQARTLEWVAISSLMHERKSQSEVAQSCLTPSDPMDCSLPGSSVHGIFQARVLEWGAIAFSLNEYWSYLICFRNQRASLPSDCLSPAEFPCIFANQSYVCCLLAGKVICQWNQLGSITEKKIN